MLLNNNNITIIAEQILKDYSYLFPSVYPDIPLNANMLKDALLKAGMQSDEQELPELMQKVELELAARVPLGWNNYGTLAILLNHLYPDEDLVSINQKRVDELSRQLPNFSDTASPDDDIINSILYTWIGLTDEETYFGEDESWA